MHALGYVADTTEKAADEFFPGWAESFTQIGKERGWRPVTRAQFDANRGPNGSYLIGDAPTVAEKILALNETLGGLSRVSFQMSVSALPHSQALRAIELLGSQVGPAIRLALR